MTSFKVAAHTIGHDAPVYFIADVGANHDGDLGRAKELIHLCAEAGAQAAKFQNFKAAKIVSRRGFEDMGGKLSHQSSWKKSVYEVYEDASIAQDWTPILKQTCDRAGVEYCTSPYDVDSVDHVDPYVRIYKIGSGDITWPEMLDYIAAKGKPVMLACGASSAADVERAMVVLGKRTNQLVLMQCNTNYTGSADNFRYVNLNVLRDFAVKYPDAVLGLSDHTTGHATVLGAVALGARVIEKHFTDDNSRTGPDHGFAMNPKTWRDMVDRTRELELAMGDGTKRIEANEQQAVQVQRRSLRATRDLAVGDAIASADLEALRPIPSDGIEPYRLAELVGKKLVRGLARGAHITWEHV
ncbi:N-acetylneuraminate synthase family protein [soil metagenome]